MSVDPVIIDKAEYIKSSDCMKLLKKFDDAEAELAEFRAAKEKRTKQNAEAGKEGGSRSHGGGRKKEILGICPCGKGFTSAEHRAGKSVDGERYHAKCAPEKGKGE